MTHIIQITNDQPIPDTERPLPTTYENISLPTLVQMVERGWAEYVPPAYDPATQTLGEYIQQGEAWTRGILPRSAEELAAARETLVMDVCESVRFYVERDLNAAGMLLVDRLVRRDPPSAKAAAVEAWVNQIYVAAEVRKAMIYAGLWVEEVDPCDFSSFGSKPYTIAQLMQEL